MGASRIFIVDRVVFLTIGNSDKKTVFFIINCAIFIMRVTLTKHLGLEDAYCRGPRLPLGRGRDHPPPCCDHYCDYFVVIMIVIIIVIFW